MPFSIQFSPRARDNLKDMRKRDQKVILDAIQKGLVDEPGRTTRNRKPLEENPLAPWELRVGDFRVFFDIQLEDTIVVILAIGRKIHNKLFIGSEEVDL